MRLKRAGFGGKPEELDELDPSNQLIIDGNLAALHLLAVIQIVSRAPVLPCHSAGSWILLRSSASVDTS